MIRSKSSILSLVCAVLLLPLTMVSAQEGDFAQCTQHFVNSKPPVIHVAPDMLPRVLCFEGFAVLHSGKTHTPIYVAERLNKQIIAIEVEREGQFYEEARLPKSERATLEDYRGSGYDRGHMAPAADQGSDSAMAQSFSLANMVPQSQQNNRKAWAKIESDTRKYVMRAEGDVFVISGPVYEGEPVKIGESKVWVPKYLFKLVYDATTKKAWAYWIENTDEARVGRPISYEEFVKRSGLEILSGEDTLSR